MRPGQLQHGGGGGVRSTGCPAQSHRRFHSLSRRYICTHAHTHTRTYTHVHIPSPLIWSPLAVLPVRTHTHARTHTYACTHLSSHALPLVCMYTHAIINPKTTMPGARGAFSPPRSPSRSPPRSPLHSPLHTRLRSPLELCTSQVQKVTNRN